MAKSQNPSSIPAMSMTVLATLLEALNRHRGKGQQKVTVEHVHVHSGRVSGEDLGAILVREGMAWAFVRYSRDYVEQEATAKAARVGVHAHDCQPAWEWRAAPAATRPDPRTLTS